MLTGDPVYRDIAVRHADKTLENHFRPDASSWHVVSYNNDGTIERKQTHQGYSDDSRWARGQAWGLYGYTVCYRYTKDSRYIEQACRIAAMIMEAVKTSDAIPYWDYDDPDIPHAPLSNGFFILKHATGDLPSGVEIDAAINYADYYFLEALQRYKALQRQH
jgi:hypothetical protein